MAINNTVTLIGNLGHAPISITVEQREFIVLSLYTTDSYKKDGQWHQKASILHNVLVFRPKAQEYAKKYQTGDRIKIQGSLSYRPQKGANGYDIPKAHVIAHHIEAAPLPKKG